MRRPLPIAADKPAVMAQTPLLPPCAATAFQIDLDCIKHLESPATLIRGASGQLAPRAFGELPPGTARAHVDDDDDDDDLLENVIDDVEMAAFAPPASGRRSIDAVSTASSPATVLPGRRSADGAFGLLHPHAAPDASSSCGGGSGAGALVEADADSDAEDAAKLPMPKPPMPMLAHSFDLQGLLAQPALGSARADDGSVLLLPLEHVLGTITGGPLLKSGGGGIHAAAAAPAARLPSDTANAANAANASAASPQGSEGSMSLAYQPPSPPQSEYPGCSRAPSISGDLPAAWSRAPSFSIFA